MKKLFLFFCVGLMMMSCAKSAKQSADAAQGLQGKYEIDFSPLLSEIESDSEGEQLAVAFASMLLTRMHMTMEFDGDKLNIDTSGPVRELVNMFGDAKMPYTVDYQLRDDSVLFIREHDEEEFKEMGVLRRTADTNDELLLVTREEDGKELSLLMRKKSK